MDEDCHSQNYLSPVPAVNSLIGNGKRNPCLSYTVLVEASGTWQGHRITASAWKRSIRGIVSPSASAVLRLMTSSNFHIPPDFVVDGSPQRMRAAHLCISR